MNMKQAEERLAAQLPPGSGYRIERRRSVHRTLDGERAPFATWSVYAMLPAPAARTGRAQSICTDLWVGWDDVLLKVRQHLRNRAARERRDRRALASIGLATAA
jgi:hypothetical protein